MTIHYRRDRLKSKGGITPPNPEAPKDLISHITKHRGEKTPYTSVSEDKNAIDHFDGPQLYKTDSVEITQDGHHFITHLELTEQIKEIANSFQRKEKMRAQRAFQYVKDAKEALIDWQFNLERIDRNDRIDWCYKHVQKYFTPVKL